MQIYPWKRFWSPWTATINLGDGGFLVDPDTDWGRAFNPDLVPLSQTAEDQCLVLLGEPGIGKSSAIQASQHELGESTAGQAAEVVVFDLKPHGEESRLVHNLFGSDSWRRWVVGNHLLYLFLDGLDECRLRISNVAALLADELKKCPADRLRLRIACRTAEWPVSLGGELEAIYGSDHVRVLELAPLRRADVIQALRAHSIDSDRFFSDLDRLGAAPFAIKPVTLSFLVNVYRRGGELPSTSRELYLQGCGLLCEEVDPDRRETTRTTRLSPEQRLAVAARIAAVTTFSNRYAAWTDIDLGNIPAEDVTVAAIVGGQEPAGGGKVDVSDAAVREALATGLFSSRGAHRLGWAHATYAEFLAAHYAMQRGLSLRQLLNLTVHPDDPEGRFVPQLHEVVGWIAGMLPEFFQEVLRREPEALLRSDVASADADDRAKLVEGLLSLADQGLFVDIQWGRRQRYERLSHPGLAGQLRPYIEDKTKHLVARRVATDIAEACRLTELQDLLADIALDAAESLMIRVNAAVAVKRIADPSVKLRLKPLMAGIEDDPDDQLRAVALSTLWPEQLTAQELFAVLTTPKGDGFTYRQFVSEEVVPRLSQSDLGFALDWVAGQPTRHRLPIGFDEIVTKILAAAWAHLHEPGVLEPLARASFSRLRNHEGLFDSRTGARSQLSVELLKDADRRHRLVAELVRQLASPPLALDPGKAGICIASPIAGLVARDDFPWLGERFLASNGPEQEIWSEIIRFAAPWGDPAQLRRLLRLRSRSARLQAGIPVWMLLLGAYFPLGLRIFHTWRSWTWQRRMPKPKAVKPPPRVRIEKLLRRCESGESIAWWAVTREMTLEPMSTHYGGLEADLTTLPGWKVASPETRPRMLGAAERYLVEHDAQPSTWLGKNITTWPAAAGYAALRLLKQEAPDAFQALPPIVWSNWASIILAYPFSTESDDTELVRLALEKAPGPFLEALTALIDVEVRDDGRLRVLDRLGDAWTPALGEALATKLDDPKFPVRAMGHLLDILLDHDVPEARSFAAALVARSLEKDTIPSNRTVAAGRALLTHARDGGWEILWPRFDQDPVFGQGVIAAVVDFHPVEDTIAKRLTEEQLGRLYVWLERHYPHAEDPDVSGVHAMAQREHIAHWRDDILNYLRQCGTPAAYAALQEIRRALPELGWLTWTLVEARDALRRREWVPPSPEHVIRLAVDREKRLVQSGRDLLNVLVESLARLERELHGETPQVQFLWDMWTIEGTRRRRPKDENALSDFVKAHLERDLKARGVIVNREVEIRRGVGGSPGERTDIHVDAVKHGNAPDSYDTVSAIIETKGSWNSELRTAMKDQLVGRYLCENLCRFGLYIVGWFNCNAWDDPADRRRADADTWTRAEASEFFEGQAAQLSTANVDIRAVLLDTTLP